MTTHNPLPTVQRMFEAFANGDLHRLLETVHPDSRWTYVGANSRPTKRVYVGRKDVRKFFGKIIQNLTINIPSEGIRDGKRHRRGDRF
ncbi:MAG: nuclear transport factor 2 family protein [Propionibacteriaceae bacterium]